MLDNLKPAWRMYKCQQAMKSIPTSEILELLEEEEQPQSGFLRQQWSVAFFVTLLFITCCHGG